MCIRLRSAEGRRVSFERTEREGSLLDDGKTDVD
jgi:hypothetical protein